MHNKSHYEAKMIVDGLKKPVKRRYPLKPCPIDDCEFFGTRIDRHLMKKHGVEHSQALLLARTSRNMTVKQPKTEKIPRQTAKTYTEKFLQHYNSLEGDFIDETWNEAKIDKKKKQTEKIGNQILKLLELTFGEDVEIPSESLFLLRYIGHPQGDKKPVLIQIKELSSWQTVRNYLTALTHFINFLQAQYPPVMSSAQLQALTAAISAYKSSVHKHCLMEMETKRVEDFDRLLPMEHLNKWFAANYISAISTLKDQIPHTMTELASHHRNILLLNTSITNIKRTGIYESITLMHISKGKEMDDGSLCLLVTDGKTYKSTGAAGVLFSPDEVKALKKYIAFVRPAFGAEHDQLFCRSDGSRATAIDICRFCQQA